METSARSCNRRRHADLRMPRCPFQTAQCGESACARLRGWPQRAVLMLRATPRKRTLARFSALRCFACRLRPWNRIGRKIERRFSGTMRSANVAPACNYSATPDVSAPLLSSMGAMTRTPSSVRKKRTKSHRLPEIPCGGNARSASATTRGDGVPVMNTRHPSRLQDSPRCRSPTAVRMRASVSLMIGLPAAPSPPTGSAALPNDCRVPPPLPRSPSAVRLRPGRREFLPLASQPLRGHD